MNSWTYVVFAVMPVSTTQSMAMVNIAAVTLPAGINRRVGVINSCPVPDHFLTQKMDHIWLEEHIS